MKKFLFMAFLLMFLAIPINVIAKYDDDWFEHDFQGVYCTYHSAAVNIDICGTNLMIVYSDNRKEVATEGCNPVDLREDGGYKNAVVLDDDLVDAFKDNPFECPETIYVYGIKPSNPGDTVENHFTLRSTNTWGGGMYDPTEVQLLDKAVVKKEENQLTCVVPYNGGYYMDHLTQVSFSHTFIYVLNTQTKSISEFKSPGLLSYSFTNKLTFDDIVETTGSTYKCRTNIENLQLDFVDYNEASGVISLDITIGGRTDPLPPNPGDHATEDDFIGNLTCGNTSFKFHKSLPNFTNVIFDLLKIATPVIVIITGMLDMFKAVAAQKEDEIKKGQQKLLRRLLAGAIVFLVFVIVETAIHAFAEANDAQNAMDCVDCFLVDSNSCTNS